MFIRSSDRDLLHPIDAVPARPPRVRHLYPMRILARVFAVVGLASAVYTLALIGLFFQSAIITF